jgi:hypothetical protein
LADFEKKSAMTWKTPCDDGDSSQCELLEGQSGVRWRLSSALKLANPRLKLIAPLEARRARQASSLLDATEKAVSRACDRISQPTSTHLEAAEIMASGHRRSSRSTGHQRIGILLVMAKSATMRNYREACFQWGGIFRLSAVAVIGCIADKTNPD